MPHSKTRTKTKPARAKSGAKGPGKPQNKPAASTRHGTKQEAVLALLRAVLDLVIMFVRSAEFPLLRSASVHPGTI
jgi:hypothetical protein